MPVKSVLDVTLAPRRRQQVIASLFDITAEKQQEE
jgi:hypothetical protein